MQLILIEDDDNDNDDTNSTNRKTFVSLSSMNINDQDIIHSLPLSTSEQCSSLSDVKQPININIAL